ncbi:MAG: 3-keto-5-aminohexanoate cleavage protein [Lachnospirales bacterium]
MKKILISVAPVSATDTHIDPVAIANDVVACSKSGAAMVHLHVRDKKGQLTSDLSLLEETIRLIKAQCDIIVQASTGGVSNLTIEERCAPLYGNWVEATSLNVGSVNLGEYVYKNPIKDVKYCVDQIIKNKKIPEIEVFEMGMVHTAKELCEEFDFIKPVLFSVVLGHIGASPATVGTLKSMVGSLNEFFPNEKEMLWGITHAHRQDFSIIKQAIEMGASTIRIGFEDSKYINAGVTVDTNLPLVEKVASIVKEMNCLPASPKEAREMLNIPV